MKNLFFLLLLFSFAGKAQVTTLTVLPSTAIVATGTNGTMDLNAVINANTTVTANTSAIAATNTTVAGHTTSISAANSALATTNTRLKQVDDSMRFIYPIATSAATQSSVTTLSTTVSAQGANITSLQSGQALLNSSVNAVQGGLTTTNNTVSGLTNQTAANQLAIAGHETRITALESTGTGNAISKLINTSTYTLTAMDNGLRLYFTTTCTVSYSNLPLNFYCRCFQRGGTVKFTGTYLSIFSRKTVQSQYGSVEVNVDGDSNVWLTGNLK